LSRFLIDAQRHCRGNGAQTVTRRERISSRMSSRQRLKSCASWCGRRRAWPISPAASCWPRVCCARRGRRSRIIAVH